MPYRNYEEGETVLIRARVVERCSDCFSRQAVAHVVIENLPDCNYVINAFVPFTEMARANDIGRLLKAPTIDPTRSGPERSPPR